MLKPGELLRLTKATLSTPQLAHTDSRTPSPNNQTAFPIVRKIRKTSSNAAVGGGPTLRISDDAEKVLGANPEFNKEFVFPGPTERGSSENWPLPKEPFESTTALYQKSASSGPEGSGKEEPSLERISEARKQTLAKLEGRDYSLADIGPTTDPGPIVVENDPDVIEVQSKNEEPLMSHEDMTEPTVLHYETSQKDSQETNRFESTVDTSTTEQQAKESHTSLESTSPLVEVEPQAPEPTQKHKRKTSSFASLRPVRSISNFKLHNLLHRNNQAKSKLIEKNTKIPVAKQPLRSIHDSPSANRGRQTKTGTSKVRIVRFLNN
jgi:hypothetical protein